MNLVRLSWFFVMFSGSVYTRKLLQGNVVWRHADRNTAYTYPTDPYLDKWTHLLYSDKGLSEEFNFGVHLRSKYGSLLSGRYVTGEACFKSIDTDRALISAQAVAAGLYESKNSSMENIKNTIKPFPVHTTERLKDWMFQISQDPVRGCPNYNTVIIKSVEKSSEWYKTTEEKYRSFFKILGEKTGFWIPFTFQNISSLYDNLQFLHNSGNLLPSWAEEHILKRIGEISGYALGLPFTDYELKYSKTLAKCRSGVFMEHLLNNMKEMVKGRGECSLNGYAVNDEGIAALLTSLGAYNWIVPPYVSSVLVDLYEEDDGTHSVELSFKNETHREPYPLHFYECESNCSWDKFKSICKLIATDETTSGLCGLQNRHDCCKYLIPGILLLMSTNLLFFPLFYCLRWLNARKKETKYNILPLHEMDSMMGEKSL